MRFHPLTINSQGAGGRGLAKEGGHLACVPSRHFLRGEDEGKGTVLRHRARYCVGEVQAAFQRAQGLQNEFFLLNLHIIRIFFL